jgi:release factor glutamine methyltransferase
MTTIRQAIDRASDQLNRAGIEAPRRTASTLLAHILQKDMIYILTRPDEVLTEDVLKQFDEAVNRRASGEPLQYITGHQEFYGLDFIVSPAVLIPRPETELIVEDVLKRNTVQGPLILDVGTGSGCLAITLAVNLPQAHVIALELSSSALEIARQNAERHGVADRIDFLPSDLFSALEAREPPVQADFIVANPPYVSESEMHTLQREVREHEPRLALLSGEDSTAIQRRLFHDAPKFVKPGGYLICEMGYGQYPAIMKLVDQSLWSLIESVRDLQGLERTLVLQRM